MWSYSRAVAGIEKLRLSEKNMRLACYWLSLWADDRPPTLADLDPRKITELLPGIVLVDVHEGRGPVCRLSGTAVDAGMGRTLRGANLLDFVAGAARATRISRVKTLLEGAASVSRTSYSTRHGAADIVETLQLPFAGVAEDGSRRYFGHVNWRPGMGFARDPAPGLKLGMPETFEFAEFG